jgi:uncharacterized membrane protein (UPF0127 family)
MKSSFITLLFSLAFLVFLQSCNNKDSGEEKAPEKGAQLKLTEEVTFLNTNGDEISTIRVALADDQQSRNQGLMDVNDLPNDAGMLFIFEEEEELSFYMANTPLPLDIMFVSADSNIIRIHHNTSPFSSKQLLSDGPAQYVVETNAGYAVANDIQEGMKIRF